MGGFTQCWDSGKKKRYTAVPWQIPWRSHCAPIGESGAAVVLFGLHFRYFQSVGAFCAGQKSMVSCTEYSAYVTRVGEVRSKWDCVCSVLPYGSVPAPLGYRLIPWTATNKFTYEIMICSSNFLFFIPFMLCILLSCPCLKCYLISALWPSLKYS